MQTYWKRIKNFFAAHTPNLDKNTIFAITLTIIFAIVLSISIHWHEPWRDEIQAWNIATASHSLSELKANLRYESGHVIAWHLILFVFSSISNDIFMLVLANALIMIAGVWLFAQFAPFSKIQKVLWTFGYFTLYEYGTMARGYGLLLLGMYIFMILLSRPKPNTIYLAIICFLLAETNIAGILTAIVLGVYLFDFIDRQRTYFTKKNIGATGIWLSGIALGMWQILPPSDSVYSTGYHLSVLELVNNFLIALSTIWRTHVPFILPKLHFWNYNILDQVSFNSTTDISMAIGWTLGIALSITIGYIIAQNLNDQRQKKLYIITTVIALGFLGLISGLSLRHYGPVLFTSIIAWWLTVAKYPSSNLIKTQKQKFLITTFFFLQCISSLTPLCVDAGHRFSNLSAAADILTQAPYNQYPIAGATGELIFGLSAYTHKPVYVLDEQRELTFMRWDKTRIYKMYATGLFTDKPMSFQPRWNEIISRANNWKRKNNGPVIIVLSSEPPAQTPGITSWKKIAAFNEAIQSDINIPGDEHLSIYLLQ